MNHSTLYYEGVTAVRLDKAGGFSVVMIKKIQYLDESRILRRKEIITMSRQRFLTTSEPQVKKHKPRVRAVMFDRLARKMDSMMLGAPAEDHKVQEERPKRTRSRSCKGFRRDWDIRTNASFLARVMTVPEWIITPPKMLNSKDWLVYSKPYGKRCFVVSVGSNTFVGMRKGTWCWSSNQVSREGQKVMQRRGHVSWSVFIPGLRRYSTSWM